MLNRTVHLVGFIYEIYREAQSTNHRKVYINLVEAAQWRRTMGDYILFFFSWSLCENQAE